MFNIVDEDNTAYHTVVDEESKEGPLNLQFITEGLASVNRNLPTTYHSWAEAELVAKTNQLKIWEHGGGIDEDD